MSRTLRNVVTAVLLLCLAVAVGCSRDPNVRKQKYLESGRRYVSQGKYAEAAIQFGNAVKIDPRFGQAHYELAQAYIKLGNGDGAYVELLRTLDLQPDNIKAQLDLANLLYFAHEYQQAIEHADLVLQKEPRNADALMAKGMALSGKGDQIGALAAMKQAVVLSPQQAGFYSNLGIVQVATGDLVGAEQSFRKATEIDPKSTAAVLALANFYEQQHRAADAEAQFQKAVQLAPESAENRRNLANFYFRRGQMAAAEKVATQAKKDLPNSSDAYRMLGDFYQNTGQNARATVEYAELFSAHKDDIRVQKNYVQLLILVNRIDDADRLNEQILKKNAKDTDALRYKAQILLRRGQAADAIPILETVIKTEPDNAQAHNYLGQALDATGNSERAVAEWTQAVRLRPTLTDPNRRLAQIAMAKNDAVGLRRAGEALITGLAEAALGYTYVAMADVLQQQPKAADAHFRQALEIDPNNAFVNTKLAVWKMKQRLFPEAEASFERALATDPNGIEALGGLVALYRSQNHPEKGIARVQAQLAKVPQNSIYHQFLGELLVGQRDMSGAEAELKKALELPNPTADAVLMLAHVQAALSKPNEALHGYERFSVVAPNDPRGYFFQGVFQQARGNFKEAEELYRKALTIDPEHPQAAAKLASLMLQQGGNTDVALSLAQTARRRAPELPDIADTLAWAYYHKGVYSSARKLLDEAISKDPNNPTYHFHLGSCYAGINDKAKARVELQRALQLNPNFPEAEQARRALAEL